MRKIVFLMFLLIGASAAIAAITTEYNTFEEPRTFTGTNGEILYKENCAGCHMPDGKGSYTGAGMYPALAGNPNLDSPYFAAFVIMNGLRGMPSFSSDYSDEQVAAIVNWLVANLGNKGKDTLTDEDMAAFRPEDPVVYIEW